MLGAGTVSLETINQFSFVLFLQISEESLSGVIKKKKCEAFSQKKMGTKTMGNCTNINISGNRTNIQHNYNAMPQKIPIVDIYVIFPCLEE